MLAQIYIVSPLLSLWPNNECIITDLIPDVRGWAGGEGGGAHLNSEVDAASPGVVDDLKSLCGVPSTAQHVDAGAQAVLVHALHALHDTVQVGASRCVSVNLCVKACVPTLWSRPCGRAGGAAVVRAGYGGKALQLASCCGLQAPMKDSGR